jgi:hypothetical protein
MVPRDIRDCDNATQTMANPSSPPGSSRTGCSFSTIWLYGPEGAAFEDVRWGYQNRFL